MNARVLRCAIGAGWIGWALVTGGCSSGPWVPEGFDGKTDSDRPQVLLLDSELKGVLQVDDIELDWTEDGRLWARSRMRNSSGDPLQIQVLTSFRDRRGNAVESHTEWRVFLIGPRETLDYECKAISKDAQDYSTQIRVAREA